MLSRIIRHFRALATSFFARAMFFVVCSSGSAEEDKIDPLVKLVGFAVDQLVFHQSMDKSAKRDVSQVQSVGQSCLGKTRAGAVRRRRLDTFFGRTKMARTACSDGRRFGSTEANGDLRMCRANASSDL